MKFSIALSLLLAGLVSGKITEAEKTQVDKFLRQSQKLSSDFKIKSFQINGQNAQVTYEKQSERISFGVEGQNGQYHIVSSQDIVSLKMNTPMLSIDFSGGVQGPLAQGFNMNPFKGMQMHNPFGNLEEQISKIQNMMKFKASSFQRKMKDRKSQMQKGFLKNMKHNQMIVGGFFQPPMLLGGPHDMWQSNNIQNHIGPLIGGDEHDNWQQLVINRPQTHMRGKGDHDLWRKKDNSQGKHHKNWKKQYEKFLTNPHKQNQKQNWLSNHMPKFGQLNPLESLITKSIFNQGKKIVENTLQNLKDKVWNKKNTDLKKDEQKVQLPLILGGDNDPDHQPHKDVQKVQKNDKIQNIVTNIIDLVNQVKQKQLLTKENDQNDKNQTFEDLDDEDQGQKEGQGKLKVLIK